MNTVFPYFAALLSAPSPSLCDTRLHCLLPCSPSSLLSPRACSDSAAAAPNFSVRLPSLPFAAASATPSPSLPSRSSSIAASTSTTASSASLALPPHTAANDDTPRSPSASASQAAADLTATPSPTSASTSASSLASASVSAASNPHSIDWSDVSLPRFALWMSVFSIAENALFYPFFLLKTREQADRSANYNALESARRHVRAALHKGGVRGLYKGFASSSVVTLPAYGVYSGVYTWAKERMGYSYNSAAMAPDSFAARHPVLISYAAPFLAGLIADAASVTLYVPGDVIVQRLQLPNSPYTSFVDASVKTYQREGIAGFYRGFGATFVTSALASAIWWLAYEQSKDRLYRLDARRRRARGLEDVVVEHAVVEQRSGSLWAALTEVNRTPQLVAGFIAGTVTSSLINPLDVVKTRLQVQDSTHPTTGEKAAKGRYRNFLHGLRQVYVEEGMRGYVRGLVPKLVSRGPLSAMSSLMYEMVLYLSRKEQGIEAGVSARKLA